MNAQLQYRRNDNEQNSLFPALGGDSHGSSLTVPVSLNIARRRTLHNVNVNFSRTSNDSQRTLCVCRGRRGQRRHHRRRDRIRSTWGVPTLTFSSLTSVRDVVPSERTDRRFSLGYTWTQPWRTHTLRAGGDFRIDQREQPDRLQPARHLRLHRPVFVRRLRRRRAAAASISPTSSSALPQQATLQYGPGNVVMNGPVDEPVRAGRLAQERGADLQPRSSLRVALAVRRRRRAHGQPRRAARLQRRRARAVRRDRSLHRAVSQPRC